MSFFYPSFWSRSCRAATGSELLEGADDFSKRIGGQKPNSRGCLSTDMKQLSLTRQSGWPVDLSDKRGGIFLTQIEQIFRACSLFRSAHIVT